MNRLYKTMVITLGIAAIAFAGIEMAWGGVTNIISQQPASDFSLNLTIKGVVGGKVFYRFEFSGSPDVQGYNFDLNNITYGHILFKKGNRPSDQVHTIQIDDWQSPSGDSDIAHSDTWVQLRPRCISPKQNEIECFFGIRRDHLSILKDYSIVVLLSSASLQWHSPAMSAVNISFSNTFPCHDVPQSFLREICIGDKWRKFAAAGGIAILAAYDASTSSTEIKGFTIKKKPWYLPVGEDKLKTLDLTTTVLNNHIGDIRGCMIFSKLQGRDKFKVNNKYFTKKCLPAPTGNAMQCDVRAFVANAPMADDELRLVCYSDDFYWLSKRPFYPTFCTIREGIDHPLLQGICVAPPPLSDPTMSGAEPVQPNLGEDSGTKRVTPIFGDESDDRTIPKPDDWPSSGDSDEIPRAPRPKIDPEKFDPDLQDDEGAAEPQMDEDDEPSE